MTTIIYIPLDERPVNLHFPGWLLANESDIQLITPPLKLLGAKKTPAGLDKLWAWMDEKLPQAQYLIASLDMLFYGGIVPSRLHHYEEEHCQAILQRLTDVKANYPALKICAFSLIMRVPSYNSCDEEPDYYEKYGERIFRWGWLQDQVGRGQGGTSEKAELAQILASIPEDIRADYVGRRKLNHFVNTKAIQLTAEGILDFLVIPLDDCAEYGFSAAEQRTLLTLVEEHTLQDRIHIYPGADEIGCTLLCRIYNELKEQKPRVYVRYSSVMGPQLVPRYEDRPLGESIKSQVTVCGGIMVDNSTEADLILMVNSPTLGGAKMQEAADAVFNKDTSYHSFRNLREFSESISYYLSNGKNVALGDVSFGNGADHELMRMLAKQGSLQRLTSFAAWNTPGNTLGTVIAHAMIRIQNKQDQVVPDKFLMDRFVEDWGYQVLVRTHLREEAEKLGITYFDLRDEGPKISKIALDELHNFMEEYLGAFQSRYQLNQVYFPWNRLFEIGLVSQTK